MQTTTPQMLADAFLGIQALPATGALPGMPGPVAPFQPICGRPVPALHRMMSAKVQALLARPLSEFSTPAQRSDAPPVTHAALVLDKSVSMTCHRQTALAGFNAQVGAIREGAKSAGRTLVSLNQFASESHLHYLAQPVECLLELEATQYQTDGPSTALYDAIGHTIEQLLEQPDIEGANTAVLVSVFTDGAENSSGTYSAQALRELISRLEATGRWTFALMGPTGTAMELADMLNLARGNVSQFNPQDVAATRRAFADMAMASSNYMSVRSTGATMSANVYGANPPHED